MKFLWNYETTHIFCFHKFDSNKCLLCIHFFHRVYFVFILIDFHLFSIRATIFAVFISFVSSFHFCCFHSHESHSSLSFPYRHLATLLPMFMWGCIYSTSVGPSNGQVGLAWLRIFCMLDIHILRFPQIYHNNPSIFGK